LLHFLRRLEPDRLLCCRKSAPVSQRLASPDANILLEAIKELRKRTTAGATTFLVKVKAHQEEPANEEAVIQAHKAISGKGVPTEWHDRTNRAVFTW